MADPPSPPPSPPASPTDALLPSLGKVERHGDSVFGVVQPRDATLLYASPNAGRVFAAPPGGLAGCVRRAGKKRARAAQLPRCVHAATGNSHRSAVCVARCGASERDAGALTRARARARRCAVRAQVQPGGRVQR